MAGIVSASLSLSFEETDLAEAGPSNLYNTQRELFPLRDSLQDERPTMGAEATKSILSPPVMLFQGRTLTGDVVPFYCRRTHEHVLRDGKRDKQDGRLDTPFFKLLRQVEQLRMSNVEKPSRTRVKTMNEYNQKDPNPDFNDLWVEKYRPRRFTELLAVDKANVEVLQWVSRWRRHIQQKPGESHKGPKRAKWEAEETEAGDDAAMGLPERRILLLAGPPGLGKTTLAHVVAQAADFQIVEINASDERGGDAVLTKIDAAVTSDSMLPGRRPNLLVIDEIDGALAGGDEKSLVNYLVQLATSHAKPGPDGLDSTESRKAKYRTRKRVLGRPIVCICNDLYVSALKPLRQVAHIVHLRKPAASLLASRLRHVCQIERLPVDGKALMELADLMECDVRASLHALQFISRRAQKTTLTVDTMARLVAGLKDAQKSPLAIYDAIFHRDSRTAKRTLTVRPLDHLIDILSDHGDCARIAMGVFEVYPQCKFHDDTRMSKVNVALDWLGFLDLCGRFGYEERLAGYLPFVLAKTHQLLSSPVHPALKTLPRADYERHQQSLKNRAIITAYRSALPPSVSASLGRSEACIVRMMAVVGIILSTQFRVLLKSDERTRLDQIVQVMLHEGLSFKQTRRPDGSYDLVLDPPIDHIADLSKGRPGSEEAEEDTAPSTKSSSLVAHSNAIRQMIAAELEATRIRSTQARRGKSDVPSAPWSSSRASELIKAYAAVSTLPASQMPVSKLSSIKKDFFGRPVAVDTADHPPSERPAWSKPGDGKGPTRIWYKHNEGFTNAVRRPLKIKDLFSSKPQ